MELELLKKFYSNNICMWNPNTNYLMYLKHFEKILNYCIENKVYKLTYSKWLDLLNSESDASNPKIGSETHNICHGLNIIESTYKYGNTLLPDLIDINIPRDLLYQYMVDDRKISFDFWKIIQNRYFKFLNETNIFELENCSHIQRVCFNLFVCYLLDSKKFKLSDISSYIKFAKDSGEQLENKILKVYNYDVCKPGANILEKLEISANGHELVNGEKFIRAIMLSLGEEKNVEKNRFVSHFVVSIKDYSSVHKKFFDKYGYMYWQEGQGRKYKVGDVMYLYFSNDNGVEYSRIMKKAIITDVNVPKQKLNDELYFENLGLMNKVKADFYIKVKLVGHVDSMDLSFKNLNDKFGFSVPQLGSTLVQNDELIDFIESYFASSLKHFHEDQSLNEVSLGSILKEFYESDKWNKNTGIMLFGIKYGNYIVEKNMNRSEIVEQSGIGESYLSELNKAISLKDFVTCSFVDDAMNIDLFSVERKQGGFNQIYYGTPGCGKSFKVNKEFNENDYLVYRTTFHPEYSNSDFVGQIIPKITESGGINYEFQEGPFTLALCEAMKNPSKRVCLIIEEINRGNASAIFGDIFQLLDREKDGSSVYSINNELVKNYLNKKGISCSKVTIPSNMWIIATMNTNDQNVFTLDTAFKRRWRMHRIINEFNKEDEYDSKLSSMYIPGSSYTWEDFITTINKEIMDKNPTGLNSEDKQLGVYFVTENELSAVPVNDDKEAMDRFIEKVLLYIWDDVAKLDPTLWFDDNINSFDELVKSYYDNRLRIFKDMFKDQNNESQVTVENEEN